MQLKTYQEQALDTLDAFFEAYRAQPAGQRNPQQAYRAVTRQPNAPYFSAPGMPDVPYICLRIPTGGGKTLIAAHAVGRINRGLMQQEHSLVLWLAPTDQIVTDTLRSLRNRAHPYRQALEASVGGSPVEVMDLTQAMNMQRTTLDGSTVVVVATIASLRVSDTTGRKVYASNGRLMAHFSGLPQAALEPLREPAGENGQPGEIRYSLANVLRLRRPVVIVDEAHNASTALSFETLARFAPSVIFEMTATPNMNGQGGSVPSNVIYVVSASQLKAEGMIKMPLRLDVHPNWQTIVGNALEWRDRLEQDAQAEATLTGENIRPIILYQAQSRSQTQETITVEKLRHELVERRGIPAAQVAIATGELNELRGVDLNDPACPVRHVITVEALREGWDCPQAYILCSVANLRSQTAIEQLVGRVLRMPRATPKRTATLNHAYVYAVSNSLADTLRKLGDGLVASGFSRFEARQLVDPPTLPGMAPAAVTAVPDRVTLSTPANVATLPPALQAKVSFNAATNELVVAPGAVFDEVEANDLLQSIPDMGDQIQVEQMIRTRQAAPSDRRLPFQVPLLAVPSPQGAPSLFDASILIEAGWSLDQAEAALTPEEYEGAALPVQRGLIDIDASGRVTQAADPLAPAQAMLLNIRDPNVTTTQDLALWLDRAFRHETLGAQESMRFIMRLLQYLQGVRGMAFENLHYDQYRLRDAVQRKIEALQQQSRRRAYQQLLPDLVVTPDTTFDYPADYPAASLYDGPHQFQRHYYPRPGELAHGTEEFNAAVALDSLPGVRYWVRNLSGRPQHSFWLQTSTDRHYPDFVALLDDGRVVAIEYKGAHLAETPDTLEKRGIGALWTAASDGRALYVLLLSDDVPRLRQLLDL